MVIARDAGESLKRAPMAAVWLWLCLAGPLPLSFAEDSHAGHATDESESRSGISGHSIAADPQSKKQALTLGFIMLGCIIVGGTMLLALVVMWGNRTRRLARSPLPPVSKRDELWFLKPKKNADEDLDGEMKDTPNPGTKPERE
jgi:hypothetical protein